MAPIDPQKAMTIALVERAEARRLVAVWPTLDPATRKAILADDDDGLAWWLEVAGVPDIDRNRALCASLTRSGVCGKDGSVQDEVARAIVVEGLKAIRAGSR